MIKWGYLDEITELPDLTENYTTYVWLRDNNGDIWLFYMY